MAFTITNEKLAILDVVADGPTIKLLAQLPSLSQENSSFVKEVLQKYLITYQLLRLPPCKLSVGVIALAHLDKQNESSTFCRVQIVDNKNWSSGYVSVLLLDECKWNYEIEFSELYLCPPEIEEIPFCSEVFCLADVAPSLHTNLWSHNCIASLRVQLIGRDVTGTVCREKGKMSLLRPYEPNDQGQLLAETMFQFGMAYICPSFPGMSPLPSNQSFFQSHLAKKSFLYPELRKPGPQSRSIQPRLNSPSNFGKSEMDVLDVHQVHVRSQRDENDEGAKFFPQKVSDKSRYFAIEMELGHSDKCIITYIENGPWKFYIRLKSQDDLWQHLDKSIEEAVSKGNFVPFLLGECGIPVLCKSEKGNKYCRGLFLDINDGKISVFLVDKGTVEELPCDKVWALPEELIEIPLLIVACRLQGLPLSTHRQISRNFRELVQNRIMKVTFGKVTADLLVNVYLEIDKYSVLKLIMNDIFAKQSIIVDTEVIVSHVSENQSMVYVHLAKSRGSLDQLQRKVQEHNAKLGPLAEPLRGQPCIAIFSEDRNWYRAVILSLKNGLKVRFADYGNEEEYLTPENLKEIDSMLLSYLPSQAIPCILDGLENKNIDSNYIMSWVEDVSLVVVSSEWVTKEIEGIPTSVQKVKLVDSVTKKSLNEALLKNASRKCARFSSEVTKMQEGSQTSVDVQEVPIVPDWLKLCKVTHVDSPLHFYVTLLQNKRDIMVINETLKSCFGALSPVYGSSTSPSGGEHVMICIKSPSGDIFHRAIVKSSSLHFLELKLVDVGRDQIATNCEVKPLPPEVSLTRFPAQAIKCGLENALCIVTNKDAFKASVTKELVNVHFLRREGDTWKVSLLETSNLTYDCNGNVKESQNCAFDSSDDAKLKNRSPLKLGRKAHSPNVFPDIEASKEPRNLIHETVTNRTMSGPFVQTERRGSNAIDNTSSTACGQTLVAAPSLREHNTENKYPGRKTRKDTHEPEKIAQQPPLASVESVFVTYHDDASNVTWVQRKADLSHLIQLNTNVEEEVTTAKSLTDAPVGSLCLCQSVEDSMWYRARVMSTESDFIIVHYVDYGNLEQIPKLKVKELSRLLYEPHNLGYSCILNEKTSDSLTASLASFVDEEIAVRVLSKEVSNYVIELIDTTTNPSEEKTDREAENHKVNILKQIPELEPPVGVDLELFVSYVDESGSLWVQLCSNSSCLDELMNNLSSLVKNAEKLETYENGICCAGKYSQDDEWYRTKMISVNDEKNEATINFVDYGNVETTSLEELRLLPESCFSLPAQAFRCNIYSDQLYCVLKGREIKPHLDWLSELTITASIQKDVTCNLILKNIFVNGEPVESKIVTEHLSGNEVSSMNEENSEVVISDESGSNLDSRELYDTADVVEDSLYVADALENLYKREVVEKSIAPPKPDCSKNLSLIVTFVENDGSIWVQDLAHFQQLDNMMKKIQAYIKNVKESSLCLNVGSFVISKFPDDGDWYRAKILSTGKDSVHVQYVDYGNVSDVPLSDIYNIAEEFCDLPSQAFCCTLDLEKDIKALGQTVIKYLASAASFEGKVTTRDEVNVLTNITIDEVPLNDLENFPQETRDTKDVFGPSITDVEFINMKCSSIGDANELLLGNEPFVKEMHKIYDKTSKLPLTNFNRVCSTENNNTLADLNKAVVTDKNSNIRVSPSLDRNGKKSSANNFSIESSLIDDNNTLLTREFQSKNLGNEEKNEEALTEVEMGVREIKNLNKNESEAFVFDKGIITAEIATQFAIDSKTDLEETGFPEIETLIYSENETFVEFTAPQIIKTEFTSGVGIEAPVIGTVVPSESEAFVESTSPETIQTEFAYETEEPVSDMRIGIPEMDTRIFSERKAIMEFTPSHIENEFSCENEPRTQIRIPEFKTQIPKESESVLRCTASLIVKTELVGESKEPLPDVGIWIAEIEKQGDRESEGIAEIEIQVHRESEDTVEFTSPETFENECAWKSEAPLDTEIGIPEVKTQILSESKTTLECTAPEIAKTEIAAESEESLLDFGIVIPEIETQIHSESEDTAEFPAPETFETEFALKNEEQLVDIETGIPEIKAQISSEIESAFGCTTFEIVKTELASESEEPLPNVGIITPELETTQIHRESEGIAEIETQVHSESEDTVEFTAPETCKTEFALKNEEQLVDIETGIPEIKAQIPSEIEFACGCTTLEIVKTELASESEEPLPNVGIIISELETTQIHRESEGIAEIETQVHSESEDTVEFTAPETCKTEFALKNEEQLVDIETGIPEIKAQIPSEIEFACGCTTLEIVKTELASESEEPLPNVGIIISELETTRIHRESEGIAEIETQVHSESEDTVEFTAPETCKTEFALKNEEQLVDIETGIPEIKAQIPSEIEFVCGCTTLEIVMTKLLGESEEPLPNFGIIIPKLETTQVYSESEGIAEIEREVHSESEDAVEFTTSETFETEFALKSEQWLVDIEIGIPEIKAEIPSERESALGCTDFEIMTKLLGESEEPLPDVGIRIAEIVKQLHNENEDAVEFTVTETLEDEFAWKSEEQLVDIETGIPEIEAQIPSEIESAFGCTTFEIVKTELASESEEPLPNVGIITPELETTQVHRESEGIAEIEREVHRESEDALEFTTPETFETEFALKREQQLVDIEIGIPEIKAQIPSERKSTLGCTDSEIMTELVGESEEPLPDVEIGIAEIEKQVHRESEDVVEFLSLENIGIEFVCNRKEALVDAEIGLPQVWTKVYSKSKGAVKFTTTETVETEFFCEIEDHLSNKEIGILKVQTQSPGEMQAPRKFMAPKTSESEFACERGGLLTNIEIGIRKTTTQIHYENEAAAKIVLPGIIKTEGGSESRPEIIKTESGCERREPFIDKEIGIPETDTNVCIESDATVEFTVPEIGETELARENEEPEIETFVPRENEVTVEFTDPKTLFKTEFVFKSAEPLTDTGIGNSEMEAQGPSENEDSVEFTFPKIKIEASEVERVVTDENKSPKFIVRKIINTEFVEEKINPLTDTGTEVSMITPETRFTSETLSPDPKAIFFTKAVESSAVDVFSVVIPKVTEIPVRRNEIPSISKTVNDIENEASTIHPENLCAGHADLEDETTCSGKSKVFVTEVEDSSMVNKAEEMSCYEIVFDGDSTTVEEMPKVDDNIAETERNEDLTTNSETEVLVRERDILVVSSEESGEKTLTAQVLTSLNSTCFSDYETAPTVDNDIKSDQRSSSLDSLDELIFFGTVSHIAENPGLLWIQKNENMKELQEIEMSLIEESKKGLTKITRTRVGQICCSYFCGQLLRAKILAMSSTTSTARVHFIDIGNKGWNSLENLFECPPAVAEVSPMASPFLLPIHINQEDSSRVISFLTGHCYKANCAYIELSPYLRSSWKNEFPYAEIASDTIGSISGLLLKLKLGSDLTHKEIVHMELLDEFRKAVKNSF